MKWRDVAGASHRELEAVDVEALLIGVGQQPDKVVLLNTLRGEVGIQVAAWRPCNESGNCQNCNWISKPPLIQFLNLLHQLDYFIDHTNDNETLSCLSMTNDKYDHSDDHSYLDTCTAQVSGFVYSAHNQLQTLKLIFFNRDH